MDLPDNIPALRTAIGAFNAGHSAALPAAIRDEIMAGFGESSCVTQFTRTAEALYAAVKADGPDALTGETRKAAATLAGQLANFVGVNFGTMSVDDRGMKIHRAMRRELGETTTPVAANDPAVAEQFAPAAAVAESATAPAPAPEPVQ